MDLEKRPARRRYAGRNRLLFSFSILFACLVGAATGVGAYTFLYAKGASYLVDDPQACANCHIMQDNFDAWNRSSHHAVATCNDCHSLHDPIGKLWTKARNGFNHSLAFTTGNFPEPIMITPANRAVTEFACRYCHQPIVEAIDTHFSADDSMSCIRCHSDVGHMH